MKIPIASNWETDLMCQAYEAEYSEICKQSDKNTIDGFLSALDKNGLVNPYHAQYQKYSYDSWQHGWNCGSKVRTGDEYLLPWAVECLIVNSKGAPDYSKREKTRNFLNKYGRLPVAIRRLLGK